MNATRKLMGETVVLITSAGLSCEVVTGQRGGFVQVSNRAWFAVTCQEGVRLHGRFVNPCEVAS